MTDQDDEALARTVAFALEPLIHFANEFVQEHDGTELGLDLDTALDKAIDDVQLRIMRLVEDAYNQGVAEGKGL